MPAQAGIQALPLRHSAFLLDSRFRGNDVPCFLSKNLPLKALRFSVSPVPRFVLKVTVSPLSLAIRLARQAAQESHPGRR